MHSVCFEFYSSSTALPCLQYFEQYCTAMRTWVYFAGWCKQIKFADQICYENRTAASNCRVMFLLEIYCTLWLTRSHGVQKKLGADHAEEIKREFTGAICATATRGFFLQVHTPYLHHFILHGQFEIFATPGGASATLYGWAFETRSATKRQAGASHAEEMKHRVSNELRLCNYSNIDTRSRQLLFIISRAKWMKLFCLLSEFLALEYTRSLTQIITISQI